MSHLTKCTAPLKIGSLVRNTQNGAHLMVVTALRASGANTITLQGYGRIVAGVITPVKQGRTKAAILLPNGACYTQPYWVYQHVTLGRGCVVLWGV